METVFPNGYRHTRLDETGSTNADALAAANRGEAGGLWISARRQTAGKGSRGRSWVSQEGNLFASLLLLDPAPERALAELTFVAALAVRDALAKIFLAQKRMPLILLKWPNDILVAGKKISGILLESHNVAAGKAVVIGIGVNCAAHPADALHKASDLAAEGISASAETVLAAIAGEMAARLEEWDRGAGFGAIRQAWLAEAAGLGERIYVKLPGRELAGVFEGLADDGNLMLALDDGSTVRLSTADIFFSNRN